MIKAKKSLGQNFLNNKKVLDKLMQKIVLDKKDFILEVGPGKGALTQRLLDFGLCVFAVEKDHRMIAFLEEKFQKEISENKLQIIYGDILDFDFEDLKRKDFKIIANLPYYITGAFLKKVFSSELFPKEVILLLQKQVVENISGNIKNKNGNFTKTNKEGVLSLSVKSYGDVQYLFPVSASSFSPAPKIDSAFLKISNISKNFFIENKITEEKFFKVIKIAFASKRKMLLKNLSSKFDKKNLKNIFRDLNIPEKIRAEDLDLNLWGKLIQKIS